MSATFIHIGEPAHEAERQALRFLVQGLPNHYTVYGNPWLVERTGVIYELDAVVVAPHAIFVVEMKAYRGRVEGSDHDWYVPHPTPSPLKLNRLTAQVLKSLLKRANFAAGQVWVEGLIFLSLTNDVAVNGPASRGRVHTKKTILTALMDSRVVELLSGRSSMPPTGPAERDLLALLKGFEGGPRPVRKIREYEILETLDLQETFTELRGKNTLSGAERALRIYNIPPMGSEAERQRVQERARWEAQVLGRLGRIEGILSADPPFADDSGIVLPLEYFHGITLTTWLQRYGPDSTARQKASLAQRIILWKRIAEIMDEAHQQGVVHRLLRPDVILVEDACSPGEIRVTGFDLAKQLSVETSISLTTVADHRLTYAAPEVVGSFSSAEPASDQFSLGAILALLLTGKPLFESTRQMLVARHLTRRVRDMAATIPLTLDEAVTRMVALRPTDRFPSLSQAIEAVVNSHEPQRKAAPQAKAAPLDAENLEAGVRLGTDYEIVSRLGQGGMAVVYAARHLASGRTRALKISRAQDVAEDLLRGEYQALTELDHPNIVRVIDLTKMVEGRLTLVMERVGGQTLRQWLAQQTKIEPSTQRRLAEDLLAGLGYLEQKGVTHKDLKPDNLLVDDGHLTIIDFSLASIPEDVPYAGTALYRDPSSPRWTHGTDRFAAALCLFEVYAGRHAFNGQVPEPGVAPDIREEDIDPPGLAAFFRKALDPVIEKRFPSCQAMREALLVALGARPESSTPEITQAPIDASTPLSLTSLGRRAVKILARCQVKTVGEMLALSPSQVQGLHTIGRRATEEILAFQDQLRARGLVPAATGFGAGEPPLLTDLSDCPEPLQKLSLAEALLICLQQAGLPTIGAVASLTRAQLLQVAGIGRQRLAQVVEALYEFAQRDQEGARSSHTLDRFWELASGPLKAREVTALDRCLGITTSPTTQVELAVEQGRTQPQISHDLSRGLERLDASALADTLGGLENVLDSCAGIVRLDDLGQRFEEHWPAGEVSGQGLVRLLVRISPGLAQFVEVDGTDSPLVTRPRFDRETLGAFTQEVVRLASSWPPVEPEGARRQLATLLPHFEGDPLALGVRLCEDVSVTDSGHLFVAPIEPRQSLAFVLDKVRDPVPLDQLEGMVKSVFGPDTPYPDMDYLLTLLGELDCQVQGHQVIPGRSASVLARPPLGNEEQPLAVGSLRSPEQVVGERLRESSRTRGFRMLVTPPERHTEISRSVADYLGARWVSFEDAFFTGHASELAALERAERFVAQRDALTEAAEETLFSLLDEHGRAGNTVVLGETALLGLCDALDLPRRLYDETLSGSRGFWVLVVPGVIHNRQPLFNEETPMWHLEGATESLLNPLVEMRTPA